MVRRLAWLAFVALAAAEEAASETAAEPAAAAAAEVVELPPLNCKPNGAYPLSSPIWLPPLTPRFARAELLEVIDMWSVDCCAMWLENLGFGAPPLPRHRTACGQLSTHLPASGVGGPEIAPHLPPAHCPQPSFVAPSRATRSTAPRSRP